VPDHQDIRLTAQRLEDLHRTLQEEGLSMDETVRRVGEAVTLYRNFKKQFSSAGFEVKTLVRAGEGFREELFDWKALES
jgi:hypothetical protein